MRNFGEQNLPPSSFANTIAAMRQWVGWKGKHLELGRTAVEEEQAECMRVLKMETACSATVEVAAAGKARGGQGWGTLLYDLRQAGGMGDFHNSVLAGVEVEEAADQATASE